LSALDDLQAVMFKWQDRDTVIKPKLRRLSNVKHKWRIQLVDEDSFLSNGEDFVRESGFNSSEFDYCINWTAEKLEKWPDTVRMSWDMWDFKHLRDAEKFLTLFHLTWQQ
jgi:hypothetical protein